MKFKSYTVYDDKDFFEKYHQKRQRGDSPNDSIEQPIIDGLIGDVSGKKILDLGCGDGRYGVDLLQRGAQYYQGIEGAHNMLSLAKANLEGRNGSVQQGDIEQLAFGSAEYHMVISRLVLHYIEDLETLLMKVKTCLKEEGTFIFSVEHPIITSNYESYHQEVKRGNWIVDHYFDTGERVNQWIGKRVVKYHKTFDDYWQIIKQVDLEVVEIKEAKPDRSNFKKEEEYERRKRIPLFLFFKLKKKKTATI